MEPSSRSPGARNISQARDSASGPSSSHLARSGTHSLRHIVYVHRESAPSYKLRAILHWPRKAGVQHRFLRVVLPACPPAHGTVSAAKASRGGAGAISAAQGRKSKGESLQHRLFLAARRGAATTPQRGHVGLNYLQNRSRSLLMFNDNEYKINCCCVLKVCSDWPCRCQ